MEETTAFISNASLPGNDGSVDGVLRPSHVIYSLFLLVVAVTGTVGNVMTIVAVKIERKLREAVANYFIVNLALADFLVCSVVVPIVMVHHFMARTFLDNTLCYVSAAISGVACHTAAITMTFIALNRYTAARRAVDYRKIVTNTRVYLLIGFTWLFAIGNTVPIMFAWFGVNYNPAKYVCVCFDGTFPLQYTLGPVFIGHFLPHATTIFCYAHILRALNRSRSNIENSRAVSSHNTHSEYDAQQTSQSAESTNNSNEKFGFSVRNWSKHEIQMFKTSMWIIVFFSFCWIPYGILVLLQDLAPIQLKQTFGALCLMSFSLNPLIYGVLSRSFRSAYKRMIQRVFFCCGQNERGNGTFNKRKQITSGYASSSEITGNGRSKITSVTNC